jgi:adenine deaminase
MARRLNQEAAKAIKYGGLSEEEALKLCTLNPAKLLHLDNRMGSIKVGKDADVVLWSNNPLSIYATAEKTFVDGILYYDINEVKNMQLELAKEKSKLIQKAIEAKQNGENTEPASQKSKRLYHCDDEFIDY